MLKKILSISGRPGLFKMISKGKNMLIVESLETGKRMPAYTRDKVTPLGEISMFTASGDTPLAEVLESLKEKNDARPVDIKALGDDKAVRAYFGTILADFDEDRVYTTDIKKLLNWYNQLIAAGITSFKEDDEEADKEKADGADKDKDKDKE